MNVPEILTTPRLVLRKPRLTDAPAIFNGYAQDEEVTRFMSWRPHRDLAETKSYLQRCLEEWDNGRNHPFVNELDETAIGTIDIRPGSHGVEFGYVLARAHWGKGYMSEALASLVDWSLAQPEIFRASAFCDVENLASARVMEKAGMVFEGVLRRYFVHPNLSPEPRDCRIYAKVRD